MLAKLSGSKQLSAAPDPCDTALVFAAQSGDCNAFVQLCERHSERMLWRLHRITGNWHDAEDALQDALLNAFRNLHRFENRSSFATWFTSIAINSGLMTLRGKRGKTILLDDETLENLPSGETRLGPHMGDNPESLCARGELQHLLSAAIRRLPPVLRVATELRVVHDHSVIEIAHHLGISQSAVKSRLSRARISLLQSVGHAARPGNDGPTRLKDQMQATPVQSPLKSASAIIGVTAWS